MGRRDWAGQLQVLRIVGIGRGWARVLPSLTILLEFVNFKLTPVGSRVGNKRGCVNIGNLYVPPRPPRRHSDPSIPPQRISKDRSQQTLFKGWIFTISYRDCGMGRIYRTQRSN